ncbi:MAG: VWA domain-containing protein [Ignavibacteriales bacterium]|nr:VWA domain-containing protein [Ignavibacteriales bacterium]
MTFRLRTIEFSTLTFLKELQKTKIRRLKIRQILLLILRTLLVVFLVLAFSRPTLRGSIIGSLGTHAKTTAVLIIDDSYSMTATDEKGDLLKQAKQAAIGVVDLLKDGDEVFLIKLSDINATISTEGQSASRDFSLLHGTINEIKPSFIHRKIEDALRYSAKLLARSSNFNKEVYVFSDFQTGAIKTEGVSAAIQENLFPPEVRFFFVPAGSRTPQNFGIESVSIPNTIFELGKPFTVNVRVGNYSTEHVKNHVVSVFLAGTRSAQRTLDIQRGNTSDAEFTVTPTAAGFVDGFVELEDDELEYDNRRYFTVHIPERIRVLLVGNTTDFQYSKLALATRQSSNGSAFELQESNTDRLGSSQINGADVIVLSNPENLSTAQASQLSSFVNNGGGLIVFPGPHVQMNTFNSFASASKLPPIAGIDVAASQTTKNDNNSFVEFETVEFRHPVFQGMFEEQQLTKSTQRPATGRPVQRSIESPHINTSVRYSLTAHSTPIITLSNGSSFLIDQQLGNGHVLLFSVAANLAWSDFPFKGLFVPLLHRSVSYLAQEQSQQSEHIAGDEISIKKTGHTGEQWSIENPATVETMLSASTSSHTNIRFSGTELTGMYAAKAGKTIIQKFAVNVDPSESNTQKASDPDIEKIIKRLGIEPSNVTHIQQPQEMQRVVLQSRFGVELWKYFLIAALIVTLIEMLVARVSKRESSIQ